MDLNATQAAIRAGYSRRTAYSIGDENLKKPEVQKFLAEAKARLLESAKSRAQLVLETLERIINANVLDYINLSDPRRPVFDLSNIARDQGAVIQEISFHPRTGKSQIKLYDKIAASSHLGRFEGLSKERLQHTGPDGKPLEGRIEIEFVEPTKREDASH